MPLCKELSLLGGILFSEWDKEGIDWLIQSIEFSNVLTQAFVTLVIFYDPANILSFTFFSVLLSPTLFWLKLLRN